MNPRGSLFDRCERCGHPQRQMTPGQHGAVEAIYRDLAEQVEYPPGEKRTQREWHQLMLSAFYAEMGWEPPKFLPGLNGEGLVPVGGPAQHRLTKKQGSDLIEFARSEAVRRGARLSMSKREAEEYRAMGMVE